MAYTAYEFIFYDWRVQYSEKRVKKNIVSNYKNNRKAFSDLIYCLDNTPAFPEIEFTKNGEYISTIYSDSSDQQCLEPSLHDPLEAIQVLKFPEHKNDYALLAFEENTSKHYCWNWTFRGDQKKPGFKKFCKLLQLTPGQLNKMKEMIDQVNCEAITLHQNNSISIRFDGHSMCQYEYFISTKDSLPPAHYTQLDKNVYFGLNKSELFCGAVIYDK